VAEDDDAPGPAAGVSPDALDPPGIGPLAGPDPGWLVAPPGACPVGPGFAARESTKLQLH
jgi:hypothetical protein